MTCTEFIAQLDDLLDNNVAAPLRADLEEHLRGCEHCVITLNTTRKTIEIYRSHEIYELPGELRDRLQKAILAKCRKC
ncbi:anti-sigma factor family protein [Paracidobacterium acidisoli]|uniref:Zf-HC2 domain-containing protein n=1 Tax=Paracidobacterium acidisoli TaxID=2303751 RepID=A0A372ITN4_9BACT|nr:zf-HC2 domain-containing protein [Paracidobacterium acidisoli]